MVYCWECLFIAGSVLGAQQPSDSYEVDGSWWRFGDLRFNAIWYGYDEAVEMLTFEDDRKVVRAAILVVEANFMENGERWA